MPTAILLALRDWDYNTPLALGNVSLPRDLTPPQRRLPSGSMPRRRERDT